MFPETINILVVDDMAAMRLRVLNQLGSFGYKNVIQASNGQEAFECLDKGAAEGKPFSLVISDWNMPVMTGIDFLLKVRGDQRFKSLPFLMITAEGEKEQVVKAIKAGVSDYLIKPVNQDTLKLKLTQLSKKAG